jgi:riboflavin biosynthesis pyrimidine reductase
MAVSDHIDWARRRVAIVLSQGPSDRVVAVLLGSVDLVAAIDGRSVGLTSEADRALVRAWREVADVLLVGPRTLEAELYSGSIISEQGREIRIDHGRSPLPPIVTIDRYGHLDLDLALRGANHPELCVYVPVQGARADQRASWIEMANLSLKDIIEDARERLGGRTIVLEGGPKLVDVAFHEDVVTDLSLTIAPILVGCGPRLFGMSGEPEHTELLPSEAIDGYVFAHWLLSPVAQMHVNGHG